MTTKIQVKVKMEEKEWFENPTTFYTVDHEEIASRAPYIQLNRQSRLYLAPPGQFWDLNNTIAVNYPSPVNSQILQSSIPFTSDPKFLFFVPDLHEKMYIQWHEYLTGLGYRLEPPEHTHLLSITPADIQPYEITHQCKRLFLSDLPLAIESEPGSNLDYKTSKLRIWLQEGFFYITMDANGVPTSRVYCHATNSEMVYIRAVETKEMYRRQGYAQSMLHFALRDLFNQGFKRVVLQESEIGPEKLYLGIGFKKIGSCFECVYEK